MSEAYRVAVESLLPQIDDTSPGQHWVSLRDAVMSAAEETIGYRKRRSQDWFDENEPRIGQLIEAKRQARIADANHSTTVNKRRLRAKTAECQRGIRSVQNTWWQEKLAEIQTHADRRDMCQFYSAIKEIYGPTKSSVGGLKSSDGLSTVTDGQGILDRWK